MHVGYRHRIGIRNDSKNGRNLVGGLEHEYINPWDMIV